MPYPNEHGCVLTPANYDSYRRKNCAEKSDGKCIDVLYGKKKDGNLERHSLRYGTENWSEKAARSHCMSQKGKFEPAKHASGSLPFQNTEWAITEEALKNVLAMSNESFEAFFDIGDHKPKLTVENGIGKIEVIGPTFKYSNILTLIGIGTSYETLTSQFNEAMSNDAVKEVHFLCDTPGGQVSGTNNFCDLVYSSRGKKPIKGIITGDCYSAGYWILSACDEIIATDETNGLGSIGVVLQVGRAENNEYVITNSNAKNKRPDPSTREGQAYLRSLADKYADIFEEKVARNRGIDLIKVKNDFGHGGILLAKEAEKVKMIDKIQTYGGDMTVSVESLKKDYPEIAKALVDEGQTQAEAKITELNSKITELNAKIAELGETDPIEPELSPEAQAKIDAYEARIKNLEKENLEKSLVNCSDDQKKTLLALQGKVDNTEIVAIGNELNRLHGLIDKVGGSQGSNETTGADDVEALVQAKAKELKTANPALSETEAYIEAYKLCAN